MDALFALIRGRMQLIMALRNLTFERKRLSHSVRVNTRFRGVETSLPLAESCLFSYMLDITVQVPIWAMNCIWTPSARRAIGRRARHERNGSKVKFQRQR